MRGARERICSWKLKLVNLFFWWGNGGPNPPRVLRDFSFISVIFVLHCDVVFVSVTLLLLVLKFLSFTNFLFELSDDLSDVACCLCHESLCQVWEHGVLFPASSLNFRIWETCCSSWFFSVWARRAPVLCWVRCWCKGIGPGSNATSTGVQASCELAEQRSLQSRFVPPQRHLASSLNSFSFQVRQAQAPAVVFFSQASFIGKCCNSSWVRNSISLHPWSTSSNHEFFIGSLIYITLVGVVFTVGKICCLLCTACMVRCFSPAGSGCKQIGSCAFWSETRQQCVHLLL